MRHARPGYVGERGATVPIVALALVALIGFVALAVDVGALMVKRRSLVNAADAAALAAAQSCAKKAGQAAADGQALEYALANAGDGVVVVEGYPTYAPSCEAASGRVAVRVQAQQTTFFSPVLGFADSQPVAAEAVAIWGGVGTGDFVPFMLSEGTLLTCGIGTEEIIAAGELAEPIDCTFWMNNKIEEMGNSQWAMLNLNTAATDRWGWNVAADYPSCKPANTNETIQWIDSGANGLSLNYPDPTYVCVDSGATPPTFWALDAHKDEERLFPVNDPGIPGANPPRGYTDDRLVGTGMSSNRPHGQVNKTGDPCPLPCTPGNGGPGYNGPVDKYDIVGFAKLRIVSVERGNQGGEITCAFPDGTPRPSDSNAWCLKVQWTAYYTDVYAAVGQGDNFNVVTVRLIR